MVELLPILDWARTVVEAPGAASDPILRFAINIVAMTILVFGLYYRRYRDKELATTASMFNVFVFAVLTVLSSIEFGVAAGFGLFAILALFSLRSEPLSKIEMTYFFGSVALAGSAPSRAHRCRWLRASQRSSWLAPT